MSRRYETLDGLRGIVALTVAMYHSCAIIDRNIVPHSYLGVDIFFMLSGFVMDKAYTAQLHQSLSFWSFIRKRAIRLYPMIVLGAGLGALAALVTAQISGGRLALATLAAVLVLPFPSQGGPGYNMWPLDPPAWSLFWEIAVNILFGLGLFRWPVRGLVALLALAGVALAAVAWGFNSLEVGFLDTNAIGGPARVLFGFTAGLLISRLHGQGRLPRWSGRGWWLGAAVFVVLAFPLQSFRGAFDLFSVVILFPMLMVISVNTPGQPAFSSWSGKISYPLYLIHYPILTACTPLFARQPTGIRFAGFLALLVAYLLAAQAALVLYDEPVRARLARHGSRARAD